jgi:hypothetical protein
LTTLQSSGIIANVDAELMLRERHAVSEESFVEMVVWRVPSPVAGSRHSFKYRLVFVVNGRCVLRYDNERGEGDHRHTGEEKIPYVFTAPQVLIDDFWNDVDKWRS